VKTFRNTDTLVSRLRFRHLQLLQTVAATGSLRAAAQVMHQTQPALSKALREVEDMLGFALFERSPRGLRASPRGEVMVRGASLLLAELRHVRDEVAQDRAQAVLRLGAPPFVAQNLVSSVLRSLLGQRPPVHVLLTEQRVPQLVRLLREGELDALLTTYASEPLGTMRRERLRYEKLFDADVVVIAASAWRAPRPVTWRGLAAERWILPDPGSYIRRLAEDMFLRGGVAPPEPLIESTNPLTSAQLVAAGLGLAVVPAPAAAAMLSARRIRRVDVRPSIPSAPVVLVSRAESYSHPRVALLRAAVGLR